VADAMTNVNDYLRRKSGLDPRLVELAILVTAREMDCEYVWTAHEPAAQIIDTVKYRRPLTTLGDKEAVIVQNRSAKPQISRDAAEQRRNIKGTLAWLIIVCPLKPDRDIDSTFL
jgi:alkylhydroperoxidase family enzyme